MSSPASQHHRARGPNARKVRGLSGHVQEAKRRKCTVFTAQHCEQELQECCCFKNITCSIYFITDVLRRNLSTFKAGNDF